MSDILENPHIKLAALRHRHETTMNSDLAEQLMATKTWRDMNEKERKICVRHVVYLSTSEEDLRKRLREEFGIGHAAINWCVTDPNDVIGMEGKMLATAFGAMPSNTDAMVSIMTTDGVF